MKYYGATDQGKIRKKNQDNFLIKEQEDWLLCAVCDGIGGGKAGEVASALTIESLEKQMNHLPKFNSLSEVKSWTKEAVIQANRTVLLASIQHDAYSGMGTTLVLALSGPLGTVCVNVGDSRLYGMNEDLVALSTDHSYVNDLVRLGKITVAEARVHPFRNMLTNAMGISNSLSMDLFDIESYSMLLLASDGLHGYVSDDEIEEVLKLKVDLKIKVDTLINIANDLGGYDNVTIILIESAGDHHV